MSSLKTKTLKATFIGPNGKKFSLFPRGTNQWRLNGRNWKGLRTRPIIHAPTLSEARIQAEEILYGMSAVQHDHPALELYEAFRDTIETRLCREDTRSHYFQFAGYFCEYAQEKGLHYWHQLRFVNVQSYLQFLADKGLKSKTIFHYLTPVRFTSKWMAANYPDYYQDICSALRVPQGIGEDLKYSEEQGNPALSIRELVQFLEWLKDYPHQAILRPGVALQGLCGLQLQEALRLTWAKVDLHEGTAVIDGEVKNRWRKRKIPLPRLVVDILKGTNATHPTTEVIQARPLSFKAYCHLLKRALRKWHPDLKIAPKDMRNTLLTTGLEEGWNDYLLRRYVGHAARSVAERNYFGDQGKRLVPVLRKRIVAHIDLAVEQAEKGTKGQKPKVWEMPPREEVG